MLWYKADLFEEAGLELPPHEYGAKYTMPDGTEVDWTYDTVKEIAKLLTVDENGNDATSADFDPEEIVQYGFEAQRDDLRGLGAYWGAGSLAADDGTTVEIPEAWEDAWKFWYDRMHTDHTIMTGACRRERGVQRRRVPVLLGSCRDERELPLDNLRRRRLRHRLGPRRRSRPTTARSLRR